MKYNSYFKPLFALFVIFAISSCETDDIDPALISLTASSNSFSEDGGSVIITASLNAPATNNVVVDLTFSGTATRDVDYTLSASQFNIAKGSSTATITISSIQDNLVEGTETIQIVTSAVTNANALQNFNLTISLLDDDADTDGDGVPDSLDDCPDVAGDPANNGCPFLGFILNEINYDPADGITGDANGDGVRDPLADEFAEFFNSNATSLDISGYRVFDTQALGTNTPRHVFPAGTIVPSNKAIVLFGGGTPTGSFGGSIVQVASGGQLNLNNAGDELIVQDASGNEIIRFDIAPLSGNPNESYTRSPDVTGPYERHSEITNAAGRIFSPGTKLDGTSF